jgi:hypothetical protein
VTPVEQELHALVAEGRAHHHRRALERDRRVAQALADQLRRDLVLEHRLGQLVVDHAELVEHLLAELVALLLHLGRDLGVLDIVAVIAVEPDRVHLDQVDHALELVLEADRGLDHDRVQAQLLAELVADAERVGARAVELVDEGDARHVVPAHLAVDGVRLRLHAGDAAQHHDGAVEHAQRPLDLDREVDVAGGVDDVDVVRLDADLGRAARPGAVGRGRLDGDAALALQLHRVHLGADAVLALHLVDRVDPLGVEEDALGQRGLAAVDVRRDADVADFREVGDHEMLLASPGRGRAQGRAIATLPPAQGQAKVAPERARDPGAVGNGRDLHGELRSSQPRPAPAAELPAPRIPCDLEMLAAPSGRFW